MFIAIVGTRAAGKSSVEDFLVAEHQFQRVALGRSHPDDASTLRFETPDALLGHVTRHWQRPFVTCDLQDPEWVDVFHRRPFFLLVYVDAPLYTRYRRSQSATHLEAFVREDDAAHYGHAEPSRFRFSALQHLSRIASLHLINPFDTLDELHAYLRDYNLVNPDRLRPQWDTYFMTLASLASQRSNCMKRRVGAVLVRDRRIVATGYNGTPRHVRNCNEGGCARCNGGGPSGEGLDQCLCLHAEENALLEAGRERVGLGSVLYCNTCPCLGCAIKIVQTGVQEVVYHLSYKVDDRTEALFKEAGVVLRQHSPPPY